MRRFAANGITALRLALTPIFLWAVSIGHGGRSGWLAAGAFSVIAASDFVDGRIARRLGAASERGRLFDHLADIGFVLSALSLYVWLGIAPWWVPASIAASFAAYAADSWRRTNAAQPRLVGSRIGHAAGVMNYVLVGVLTGNDTAGLHVVSPFVMHVLFALVPTYSAAAIVTRFAR